MGNNSGDALYDIIRWNSELLSPQRPRQHGEGLFSALHVDVDPENIVNIASFVGGLVQRTGGVQVLRLFVNFHPDIPHSTVVSMLNMLHRELHPESMIVYGEEIEWPDSPLPKGALRFLDHRPCNRPAILAAADDLETHGLMIVVDVGDGEYKAFLYVDVARLTRRIWRKLGKRDPFKCLDSEVEDDMFAEPRADRAPLVMDYAGPYKPSTNGELSDPGCWDVVETMDVGGFYTDTCESLRDIVTREFFKDDEYTDDVVLTCSVMIVDAGRRPASSCTAATVSRTRCGFECMVQISSTIFGFSAVDGVTLLVKFKAPVCGTEYMVKCYCLHLVEKRKCNILFMSEYNRATSHRDTLARASRSLLMIKNTDVDSQVTLTYI